MDHSESLRYPAITYNQVASDLETAGDEAVDAVERD